MMRPTYQGMVAIEKIVCYSQEKRPNHAMGWGWEVEGRNTWGSTRVGQDTEGEEGKSLYCGFQGRNRQDRVNRFRIG